MGWEQRCLQCPTRPEELPSNYTAVLKGKKNPANWDVEDPVDPCATLVWNWGFCSLLCVHQQLSVRAVILSNYCAFTACASEGVTRNLVINVFTYLPLLKLQCMWIGQSSLNFFWGFYCCLIVEIPCNWGNTMGYWLRSCIFLAIDSSRDAQTSLQLPVIDKCCLYQVFRALEPHSQR